MKRAVLFVTGVVSVLLITGVCLGRGGAGGFHAGGAAGFHASGASGFHAGGGLPSGGAYNRSPSMSRAAPAPSTAFRSAPSTSFRPATGGPHPYSPGPRPSPGGGRPSAGELGNFLNMPRAAETHTIDGPHGGSITYGKGSGSKTLPSGRTIEGAGAGAVIEGPKGGTHVVGVGGLETSKGDRSAAAAGSIHGTQTPGGVTTGRARGVSEISGPGGTTVRGGSIGGIKGPEGGAAVHVQHGGIATGPGGRTVAHAGSATAIRGPAGAVAVTGRQVIGVRNNFAGYRWFWTPGWYARYPAAWYAAGIATAAWWRAPVWTYAYGWYGTTGQPVVYDYGTNVTYEGDTVYYGDQPAATADQYCEQASQIAQAGVAQPENEEWLPLGTFAVVSEGQTKSDKTLQLAVNREGVLRGNLHDAISDVVVPIVGSVDKQTQRAAFRSEKGPIIAECGLWNLTQDTLPVLVHFDKDRAETRTLIRLTEPESEQ